MNQKLKQILRPWQWDSSERLCEILHHFNSAADVSDCGSGKTFTALAVAQELQLPTLIVCPKIACSAWRTTAEEFFGEKFSIINYESLRTGRSGGGVWQNQERLQERRSVIHTCERCLRRYRETEVPGPCDYNAAGIHCFSTKSRPVSRGIFRFHPGVKFLIFDEVHRCGDMDSLNAEMLIAARRDGIPHLLLSATLADSPLKL